MRVRMLNEPGTIRLVNEETVPVSFIYNDSSFPAQLPALQSCKKGLELPWLRTNCAQWMLVDLNGEYVYV